MNARNTFLYFAYGSNLLQQRIHIANPTAIFKTIAKLQDFRLDFNYYSERWKGSAATIVADSKSHVWGIVYEIDNKDQPNLDRQEGVAEGVYRVIKVDVESPLGKSFTCRSYQLTDQPPPLKNGESLPSSRFPSKIYLNTIIAGAIENKIPADYIDYLKKIPSNEFNGPIHMNLDLQKYLS
ncbi:gamma-glutamylcyclotransferase isoform X2 [Nilaparvata lugens]|uniref:gamma-glutamylcyclotransferase isoform X2 n=1 Tax=Nilaparvata lugens TaxID=108931 RepID=UPI00193D3435|nr:gamma-glutamylcyclotransferase isoform X2 [Nilaparvata lugens]